MNANTQLDEAAPPLGDVARIQRLVAGHYGTSVFEITSDRRHRSIVGPRHAAMWLARRLTPLSLPGIGQLFGARDHSTVWHALRAVDDRLRRDPKFAAELKKLEAAVECALARGSVETDEAFAVLAATQRALDVTMGNLFATLRAAALEDPAGLLAELERVAGEHRRDSDGGDGRN